ncbi:hypothetical protein CC78DRAFT_535328 [Lojkania enalia]|uniref:Uncharacterized protein n=1 Tax=Lojkania enalia TaxID=147567 RepID=A0A9P4K5W8_9PLEO|nr:hypothetical protein CC78DRAFT_535328 [Didymosphaeria enalia]
MQIFNSILAITSVLALLGTAAAAPKSNSITIGKREITVDDGNKFQRHGGGPCAELSHILEGITDERIQRLMEVEPTGGSYKIALFQRDDRISMFFRVDVYNYDEEVNKNSGNIRSYLEKAATYASGDDPGRPGKYSRGGWYQLMAGDDIRSRFVVDVFCTNLRSECGGCPKN